MPNPHPNPPTMKQWDENGHESVVPYDPARLSFEHEGVQITNPLWDTCYSERVDPAAYYGFEVHETGGGCRAYVLELPDGDSLVLTGEDGSYLPDLSDDGTLAVLGRQDKEGYPRLEFQLDDLFNE